MAFSRLLFADMYSAQGHKLDIPTPKGYIVAPDKLRKAFDDGRVKAGGNNDRRFVLFARQASIDSTGLIGDTLSLSLFPYADKVYTDNEFAALKNKMLVNSKAAAASLPVGVEFKWSKDRGSWIMSMLMAPLNVVGGPSSIKTCEITGSVLIGNHVYYYSSQSIYMSDEADGAGDRRVGEVEREGRVVLERGAGHPHRHRAGGELRPRI